MTIRLKPSASDFVPAIQLEGRRVAVDEKSRRIAVRVASFGETHSGFGPMVKVPRNVNVDAAHVGIAELQDGSSIRVATLPMHTTHAPKDLQAMHAASWYENTGTAIARGRYSIDDQGVRFDGVLYDDVEPAQLDRLTASSASGDWRSAIAIKRFSDYENTPCDFVGSCVVNIPGFSDTFRQEASERFALAASAHSIMTIENEVPAVKVDKSIEVLTAGAGDSNPDGATALPDGCSGECTGCACQTELQTAPAETVTLTASAAKLLLDIASGSELEPDAVDLEAARTEATEALTASGLIAAADPRDQRIELLERMVINMAFNQDD